MMPDGRYDSLTTDPLALIVASPWECHFNDGQFLSQVLEMDNSRNRPNPLSFGGFGFTTQAAPK
jgi:hypothetical protein